MHIGALKPNPENPRTISDAKLEMLKKSLAEFGDLGGIVYNTETKQIVGGHQRAKLLNPKVQIVYWTTQKRSKQLNVKNYTGTE